MPNVTIGPNAMVVAGYVVARDAVECFRRRHTSKNYWYCLPMLKDCEQRTNALPRRHLLSSDNFSPILMN